MFVMERQPHAERARLAHEILENLAAFRFFQRDDPISKLLRIFGGSLE